MKKSYFGVDFGTTNTAVVELGIDQHGHKIVRCGIGDQGEPFPSLVAIHKETGAALYCKEVKMQRQKLASEYFIISSFKSHLGDDSIEYEVAGRKYTPTDITAMFLRYIKDYIKAYHGLDMESATFAIPVDYKPAQRRALKRAAKNAGIKVTKLISESTAAYMNNRDCAKGFSTLAIFDWGGGTIDTSILRVEGSVLRELAVKGYSLGGDDLDKLLAKKFHAEIAKQKSIGSYDELSSEDRDRILNIAEDIKIKLSDEDFVRTRLIDYGMSGVSTISIDYSMFEEIIRPEINKAMDVLYAGIDLAGISRAQLDAIIMVGGSCKMRPIRDAIYRDFEEKGTSVILPDDMQWSAAVGAAMIEATDTAYKLSQNLGVLLSDNTIYPIFKKGDIVPIKVPEKRFGVVEDTTDAHFIFCFDDKRPIHIESVPVKGFLTEDVCLNAEINDDLIGTISLRSTHMPKRFERKIELNNLRFYYDLERQVELIEEPKRFTPPPKNPVLCKYMGCMEKATRWGYCVAHYRYEHAESK